MTSKIHEKSHNLTIETILLVAIWEIPFIFQGCFNIFHQKNNDIKTWFFRAECSLKTKMDILNLDFLPEHYHFTDLFNEKCQIDLKIGCNELDLALYLLKYALKTTLEKMLLKPEYYLTHIDEVANLNLVKQIKEYMVDHTKNNLHDHIGFGVSMDFIPQETMAHKAAQYLLELDQLKKE